jgi:hypothetical protein
MARESVVTCGFSGFAVVELERGRQPDGRVGEQQCDVVLRVVLDVIAVSDAQAHAIDVDAGAADAPTGVNVTVNGNDSGQNPFAEWAPLNLQCVPGQVEVITALYSAASYFAADVGFFFSIP